MNSRLLNLHANIRQSWKFQAQAYFTIVLIAYVKRFRLHVPFMVMIISGGRELLLKGKAQYN